MLFFFICMHERLLLKRLMWNMTLTFKQTKTHYACTQHCMGNVQNKAQRNAPSVLHTTHSRRWSATHRPWAVCMHVTCVLRTVLWWGGGQDSWGREALWIWRPEESVWDEAQLWDRQKTGLYQMHTHTYTNALPPLHFPGQHPPSLTATHVLRYMWILLMKMLGEFPLLPLFLIMSNENAWWKHIKMHANACFYMHRYVTQTQTWQLLTGNNAQLSVKWCITEKLSYENLFISVLRQFSTLY